MEPKAKEDYPTIARWRKKKDKKKKERQEDYFTSVAYTVSTMKNVTQQTCCDKIEEHNIRVSVVVQSSNTEDLVMDC